MFFDKTHAIGDVGTASAAGSTQATATSMPARVAGITAVGEAEGVVLRQLGPGMVQLVSNEDSTQTLLLYPWSGAAFNGKTANEPVYIAAGKAALVVERSATKALLFASA